MTFMPHFLFCFFYLEFELLYIFYVKDMSKSKLKTM